MALSFSNTQLKTISKDILELPKIIDNPVDGTGLVQQQANVQIAKDKLFDVDQQNKVFTDHWILVADTYHQEIEKLSQVLKTNYLDSTLVLGAQSLPPHYTPTWPELLPIIDDSNNGQPETVSTIEHELKILDNVSGALTPLLSGFSYGAQLEDSIDTINGNDITLVNGASFVAGELIIIDSGGVSMLATVGGAGSGVCTGGLGGETDEATCITNGGTWSTPLSITPVSPSKTFSSGARVRNYHVGFSNSERGLQSANYANDVMLYFMSEIEIETGKLKIMLSDLSSLALGNDETSGVRKNENQAESSRLDLSVSNITTWEVETVNDIVGKFTDTKISTIVNVESTRRLENPNRVIKITEHLGSVGVGGVYEDLWKFIILRTAKSGGTLYGWYGMDLGIRHFDTKIANANTQLTEYSNLFIVEKLTLDVAIGENEVTVENVTNLSENDSIKIFDDNSPVIDATILLINGNTLTLSSGLSSNIGTASLGRIIKNV